MNVPELFGSMVFNDEVMRERLPADIYASLRQTIDEGLELDKDAANAIASAMKDWAIEKGATHFTHWFQPMTGITAEKHDSFISPQPDGKIIMEFSGKELIKGESDASSFPSGGLRSTFEARGYTSWDPTSYAFIKDTSLYIPTVFCSFAGDVLDKKTPLLRSMSLISEQALRIVRVFGDTETENVTVTVGPEQEYFLVEKKLYEKRRDLIFCGRTLFGAKPPKGQEMEDHYFGAIKPRVREFMRELNTELWKLGVYARTEHNEAAPSQHELAPIFTTANFATDHNQLTMETMKKVAEKHNLVCLLHEKPFEGVNGSGKHNNWSLSTSRGENLLKPGKHPAENKRFLLFLCAVIKAVDKHQDLLRLSVASAGNDHRLGAHEAPPAIVSMFLGDDMVAVLEAIESGRPYDEVAAIKMQTGVKSLPNFRKDTTDRNRTSPFAFTGNKFEFRMPGSSMSIAGVNIILNTIVADVISEFADRLENASDFAAEVDAILKETITAHKRIIFNGNNYTDEWVEEAKRRGLLNLKTSAEAIPYFKSPENIALFSKHSIFSESEIRSRCGIMLESYCKVLNIEALTMISMVNKDILPASLAFTKELAETVAAKKAIGIEVPGDPGAELAKKISELCAVLYKKTAELEKSLSAVGSIADNESKALYFRDTILVVMQEIRSAADELETIVSEKYWPFPTYAELLFSE